MVGVVLWKMWQGKNLLLFQGKAFNPLEISKGAATLVEEFNKVYAMKDAKSKEFSGGANNVDPRADISIYVDVVYSHNGFTTWGCCVKGKDGRMMLSTYKKERI